MQIGSRYLFWVQLRPEEKCGRWGTGRPRFKRRLHRLAIKMNPRAGKCFQKEVAGGERVDDFIPLSGSTGWEFGGNRIGLRCGRLELVVAVVSIGHSRRWLAFGINLDHQIDGTSQLAQSWLPIPHGFRYKSAAGRKRTERRRIFRMRRSGSAAFCLPSRHHRVSRGVIFHFER